MSLHDDNEQAVDNDEVTEAEIDVRVLRILVPMFELGLFDHPVEIDEFDEAGHALESQRVAEESIVLLKNTDGFLPLDPDATTSVAVIGPDADQVTGGGSSSLVLPSSTIRPLEGIRDRLPDTGIPTRWSPPSCPPTRWSPSSGTAQRAEALCAAPPA